MPNVFTIAGPLNGTRSRLTNVAVECTVVIDRGTANVVLSLLSS